MNFYDILKKIDYDGFSVYDVYTQPDIQLYIELMKKSIVNPNTRLDIISNTEFDNDRLYWILALLNKNKLNNLFWINPTDPSILASYRKSMNLEPIELLKTEITSKINKCISILSKVVIYYDKGLIQPVAYYKLNNEMVLSLLKDAKTQIHTLSDKHSIEIHDDLEHNNLNTYRSTIKLELVDRPQIIQLSNVDFNDFDFNNQNIFTVDPSISIDDVYVDIRVISSILKYVIDWSSIEIEYRT